MAQKFTNDAVSKLASSLSAAATSFAVLPGDGAKFPTLDPDDYFIVTLIKVDGTTEIMKCTARSLDTFTVERAQEGTPATTFSAGDRVELRLTAGGIGLIAQESGDALANTNAHIADKNNPHETTKTQVGLGSVENYPVASEAEAKAGASNRYMTPERTLQVLAGFGVGGEATVLSNLNATDTKPGTYRFDSTTTGTKPAGMTAGSVIVLGTDGADVSSQIAVAEAAKKMAVRFYAASAWSGWYPIHIGTVTVSTSAPSGGVDGDIWYQV